MKRFLLLVAIIVISIFSLGCINLKPPSPKSVENTIKPVNKDYIERKNIFSIEKEWTEDVPSSDLYFLYYFIAYKPEQIENFNPMYLRPYSYNNYEKSEIKIHGDLASVYFVFKLKLKYLTEIYPSSYGSIYCNLKKVILLGDVNQINKHWNKLSQENNKYEYSLPIRCRGISCSRDKEPTIIQDNFKVNSKVARILYYLDCSVNTPYYRAILVTHNEKFAKEANSNLEYYFDIIYGSKLVNYNYPTGFGPMRIQLYIEPSVGSLTNGVDSSFIYILGDNEKQIPIHVRLFNLIDTSKKWVDVKGFEVNTNEYFYECDNDNKFNSIDCLSTNTVTASLDEINCINLFNVINYFNRFSVHTDSLGGCNVDLELGKEYDMNFNVKKTKSYTTIINIKLDTSDTLNSKRYCLYLISGTLSYEVIFPLLELRIVKE